VQEFYAANKDKPLIMLKWLVTQASCCMPGNVSNVRKLMEHPAFQITNPNCCYSLFLGFARSINFHAADGSGYEFVGDAVIKVKPWVFVDLQTAMSLAGRLRSVGSASAPSLHCTSLQVKIAYLCFIARLLEAVTCAVLRLAETFCTDCVPCCSVLLRPVLCASA
jgi:hypothetical protein